MNALASPTAPVKSAAKYLTVLLASEAYGIAVLKVREIIRLQKITPLPQTPTYVKGVINLRGRVIPVIDLRVRFGLDAGVTERTCIVVVQIPLTAGRTAQHGLIVDAVDEVVQLTDSEIQTSPDLGGHIDTSYLLGMARVKGSVKMLLDIDRVVGHEATAKVEPDLRAG